ncbi:helix-turn-helix domain-containing protein [Streptomyces sp. NPDC054796]
MPETNGAPWSLTQREIGARLQELRDLAELTQEQVAQHPALHAQGVSIDPSALSRIERGKRRPSREKAEALLACYEADPETREQILAYLSVDTTRRRKPALWRKHSALLGPMQFEGYLSLEQHATTLRNFQPSLIHGLLQTPEYAHHVIASMREDLTPAQVHALVDVRIHRQRRITEGALRDFQALLDEGALQRKVGDTGVMRGQLEHLLAATEAPQNTIRVLPTAVGSHPGLAGPFVIMTFPDATRDVVWLETMNRQIFLEDASELDAYSHVFDSLWERALEPAETRSHLKNLIKEQ